MGHGDVVEARVAQGLDFAAFSFGFPAKGVDLAQVAQGGHVAKRRVVLVAQGRDRQHHAPPAVLLVHQPGKRLAPGQAGGDGVGDDGGRCAPGGGRLLGPVRQHFGEALVVGQLAALVVQHEDAVHGAVDDLAQFHGAAFGGVEGVVDLADQLHLGEHAHQPVVVVEHQQALHGHLAAHHLELLVVAHGHDVRVHDVADGGGGVEALLKGVDHAEDGEDADGRAVPVQNGDAVDPGPLVDGEGVLDAMVRREGLRRGVHDLIDAHGLSQRAGLVLPVSCSRNPYMRILRITLPKDSTLWN